MLILTRKPGQVVLIGPHPRVDPRTRVADLFGGGPIEIVVTRIDAFRVRLGIEAHPGFVILREELLICPPEHFRLRIKQL